MTWSRWRRSRESFRTTRPMRLKPNPFVSATLYHESQGERAGYGYFGKDIYGRFHKSPVLYKTEAEARDAMKKRMLRRNPPNQGLFFVTFKFQGRRVYLELERDEKKPLVRRVPSEHSFFHGIPRFRFRLVQDRAFVKAPVNVFPEIAVTRAFPLAFMVQGRGYEGVRL